MRKGEAGPHWVVLDSFVAAYETARRRDREANVADFLPEIGHPLYRQVLRELVRVDLECGWEQGQPRPLAEYLRRFPHLREDPEGLREIAFEEFRQRQQAGEDPSVEEYEERLGVVFAPSSDPLTLPSPPVLGGEGRVKLTLPSPPLDGGEGRVRGDGKALFQGPAESTPLFHQLYALDPHAAGRFARALAAMPEAGDEFLTFHLRAELGRGTFGRVFLADQRDLGNRRVALKIGANLSGETLTLVRLQHAHIIPVHSLHHAGPLQAICMPYLGAVTLADLLKDLRSRDRLPASGEELVRALKARREGVSVPPSEAASDTSLNTLARKPYVQAVLEIAAGLAEGLAYAHERGILHRDLKPANVLLTDAGQPMLLDFNLAADVHLRAGAASAFLGGTLYYSAPEFLEGLRGLPRPIDRRSDVYALGVILYELLTGRLPFPLRSGPLHDVLPQMIADRRERAADVRRGNPTISPAVEAIVRRCLEPELERRYPNAGELGEDLRRHLNDLPLRHASEPRRERIGKWRRRHSRLVTALGVGLLGIVVFVVLGSVMLARGRHLAQLEAREARQQVRVNLKTLHFFLNRPDAEQRQREEGLTLCRQTLERYRVLETADWQESPLVQALSPEERQLLREDVAELLFLWARAVGWQAAASGESARCQEQARFALELNERAAACYAPDEPPRAFLAQRAHLTQLAGWEEMARRLLDQAERTPMATPRERYLLVLHQLDRGQMSEALAYLREASRHEADNFSLWIVLGNCHAASRQYAEASACYDLALSLEPESPWAHFNRGLLHFDQGAFDKAVTDFNRVVLLRPDMYEAFFNRAMARFRLGRFDEAHADLNHVLEHWEKPPTRAYLARSRVRSKLGDTDGARRDQEEGLRRPPTDENDCIARGVARYGSEPEKALADFEQAQTYNPLSRRALQNQASVLAEKLNRPTEAVQVLDRLLALYPDSVPARAGRGVLHARLGRRDAAHEDARDALARDRQPATLYQVAGIYALTSRENPADRPEALKLLSDALQKGYGLDLVKKDSDLVPLHGDPGFQRLLETARLSR